MATTQRMGPCGGPGGEPYSFRGIDKLIEIQIWHRNVIYAISFHYYDSQGRQHYKVFGTTRDGCEQSVISLRDGENLSNLVGTLKQHNGENAVNSLLITTNLRTHRQIGARDGMDFSIPTMGGTVVGFHGNAGNYLYAIGLHLKSPGQETAMIRAPSSRPGSSSPRVEGIGRLTKIKVLYDACIHGVSVQYRDSSGFFHWYPLFSGSRSKEKTEITLDEGEIIISITGYCMVYDGHYVVDSLQITTNRDSHGPYGTESGMDFSRPRQGHTAIGFRGRFKLSLDTIGALFNIPAIAN